MCAQMQCTRGSVPACYSVHLVSRPITHTMQRIYDTTNHKLAISREIFDIIQAAANRK